MRGQLGRQGAPAGPRARTMRQGRWRNGSKYPRLGISATSPGRLLACPTPRGGRGLRLRGGRGPRATRFQDAAPRRRGGRRGQRERQGPGSGSRGEGNSGLGRTAPDQARDARGPAAAPPERSQPRGPAAKALARAAAYAAAGLPLLLPVAKWQARPECCCLRAFRRLDSLLIVLPWFQTFRPQNMQ